MRKAKFRNDDDRNYEIRETTVRITLNVGSGEYLYKEVSLIDAKILIDDLFMACNEMAEFELDDTWYNE